MIRAAHISPALCLALLLSGCAVTEQANRDIADGQRMTAEQARQLRAMSRGEVLRVDQPWYGEAVPARRGSRQGTALPERLEGARGVTLTLEGQAGIRTIAEAVRAATDIPVSVRTRYVLPEGDQIEVPIGGRMEVRHEGPLSAFLDRLAARFDVAWQYDGQALTIDRMVTRDYRVPLPVAASTFTSRLGGATGTSEGKTDISLETTQSHDPWAELAARLAPLTPQPARTTILRSSGRVSVFGPPSVQRAVQRVIEDVEEIYGQRVGLEVGIYFVDSDAAEQFGLSTTGFSIGRDLSAQAGRSSIVLGGEGGGLTLTAAEGTLNLEALARDRAVVDYRLASTIAQSGVVAPIAITRVETYIGQTTTEKDDDTGGSTRTVSPGEIEHGISIHALPRIIDRGRIQLFLTVLQSTLLDGEVRTENFGIDNKIGLPVLDQRVIQNESVLAPGETLVLSGYEQELSSRDRSGIGFLKAIGLGGKTGAQVRKVRMVVLVRPSLIPLSARRGGGT